MKKDNNKKMFYVFIGCITLSIIIIGATFAYFTANTRDENTVYGSTSTTSFSMSVSRVTTVDMAFGLIPMKNNEAPHSAEQLCYDDNENAGCQIYKIIITGDSNEVVFVDGYITTNPKDGVETRFTRVYPKEITDEENNTTTIFMTTYTKDDFLDESFNEREVIKTGKRGSDPTKSLNHADDYDCILVENEQIGGEVGNEAIFYVMIWIYDNGTNQDFMQGMELVYTGEVTFITAEGNEIKASFD